MKLNASQIAFLAFYADHEFVSLAVYRRIRRLQKIAASR